MPCESARQNKKSPRCPHPEREAGPRGLASECQEAPTHTTEMPLIIPTEHPGTKQALCQRQRSREEGRACANRPGAMAPAREREASAIVALDRQQGLRRGRSGPAATRLGKMLGRADRREDPARLSSRPPGYRSTDPGHMAGKRHLDRPADAIAGGGQTQAKEQIMPASKRRKDRRDGSSSASEETCSDANLARQARAAMPVKTRARAVKRLRELASISL